MRETHPTLYTLDAHGNVRVWWMEIEGACYRTCSGLDGGTFTASNWTTAQPKNVGKRNETSAEDQAQAEVAAEYKKKLDRKYYTSRDGVGRHKFFAPMLAHKFTPGSLHGGFYSQPKLDGFRCTSDGNSLTSRAGKAFSIPHVLEAVQRLCDQIPGLALDGELYNHQYKSSFTDLSSLIKNPARDQSPIQYHIYDVPSVDGPFRARREMLKAIRDRVDNDIIRVVPTSLIKNDKHLDELFGAYLAAGYEGQMVRDGLGFYEAGKRSKLLLKRKEFEDAEFPVSAILEGTGNWAGLAKAVEIIAPGDARCEDGKRPKAGIKGDRAFAAALLENPDRYTSVTVRFLGWTPAGVPRIPVAVAWHEGERTE